LIKLIIKRLLQAIPTLLIISAISFLVMSAAPGDALSDLQSDPGISPEIIESIRREQGLDQPVYVRYWKWLSNAARGDFGQSTSYQGMPVTKLIGPRLWRTLELSLAANILAWCVALPLGVIAAVRRDSWLDRVCLWLASAGLSTPRILLALLALLVAVRTGLFPIGGAGPIKTAELSFGQNLIQSLRYLVLPATVLSLPVIAIYLRQMRGNLLEVLLADFIRTARAKGLRESVVIGKHALRNALNPIITLFGYSIAGLLSGSIIVETVMSWPGIGQLTISAVQTRDLPVLMCTVMIASMMLLVGNLIADILLMLSDPRVRQE